MGFTAKHRKAFLDVVMRFGLPSQEFNITDSQCYVRDLKGKSEKHLRAYASLFVQHLCEPGDPNSKTFEDGVPKEGLNVNQVLARIGMVSLIRKKVHEYEDKHGLTSVKKVKKLEEKKVIDLGNTSKEFAMFEDNQNSVTEDIQKDNEEKKASDKETEKSEKDENKETDDETKEVNEKMDVEKSDKSDIKQKDNSNKEAKDKNETKTEESEEKESQKSEDNKLNSNEVNEVKVEEKDKNVEKVNKDSEEKEENIEKDEKKKEKNLEESEKEVENEQLTLTFDFNIRDGGLTELHTLWYFEEQELKPAKVMEVWHKRHDYWLLAAIVKHGYERWKEIHDDEDFSILNEPFKNSIHIKNKFMERRLRLLEQALVFEEQFRRTAHLTRISSEDKEEEDEEAVKEEETNDENKPINPTVQKCINHYEELLTDMKSDCGRIPQTVQRIPPIAQRLQISQKGFNAIGQQKRQLSL